ncbi:MAG: hypothetical protein R3E02_06855 [Blastomonas sp.]
MLRFLKVAFLSLVMTLAIAADKLPSAYDGYADSAISNSYQNMPVQLYGVAIKWNKDCLGGKAAQCQRLGDAFVEGLGDLEPSVRVALGYYLKACSLGLGNACATSATMLRDGEAGPPNPALAGDRASHGCTTLNDSASCAALGVALFRGDGMATDKARAIALWDAACAAKADDGCRLKAGALFHESSDAASHKTAVALYDTACKAGKAWGCEGMMLAWDRPAADRSRDDEQVAYYAQRGCLETSGDTTSLCGRYGALLIASGDYPQIKRGEPMLKAACLAGDGPSCTGLGTYAIERASGLSTKRKQAAGYLRRGCDLGEMAGCAALGKAYVEGNQVSLNEAAGAALLRRACSNGDAPACQLATAHGAPPASGMAIDPSLPSSEQLALARKAVDSGNRKAGFDTVAMLAGESVADAQWLLGGWQYYGQAGLYDQPQTESGAAMIAAAAAGGNVDAAIWAGMAHWYGDGLEYDRDKGLRYMAIAAPSSPMAMAIYRSMKAQPIREENARRQKEMEEAAKQRKQSWSYSWQTFDTSSSSRTSSSYSSSSSNSWQSIASMRDQSDFNQMIKYYTGGTSVCPSYNRYC